jgi:transcriptional regulator with XRE-family HTH domain
MPNLIGADCATLLRMPPRTPRNAAQLATFVRRTIKDKGLSPPQIAKRAGRTGYKITDEYVRMILNGAAKNLTIDKLQALAVGLDEPFESVLFAAAGIPENASEAFRRSVFYILFTKAEEAEPEDRKTIYELVELLNERLARKTAG